MSTRYLSEFLQLKCAPDALGTTGSLGNKSAKEITEAMAVKRQVKKILRRKPEGRNWGLVDLCTGKALIPVLTAHLLPQLHVSIGVDIREPKLNFEGGIKKFIYYQRDINEDSFFDNYIDRYCGDYILTSCHACGELSTRVVELFAKHNKFKHLVLMPCCCGPQRSHLPAFIKKNVGRYVDWSYFLFEKVQATTSDAKMVRDNFCLSPCNILIVASKV